jgi:hypothetical protein
MIAKMQGLYMFGCQESEPLDRRQDGPIAVTKLSFNVMQPTTADARACVNSGAS